jgi:hypothetical protein
MSALDRVPETTNFLSNLGFRFVLSRSPDINYFVQSVTLPEISVDEAIVNSPFNRLPYPGERVTYGSLNITFKVDEKLANYIHIYNWITDLGKQDGFKGYSDLDKRVAGYDTSVFSDATLVILTSSMNPQKQVVFRNIFPQSLSGLTFDSSQSDVVYLAATVTFTIQNYEIIPA